MANGTRTLTRPELQGARGRAWSASEIARPKSDRAEDPLSDREVRVLRLIATGHSNAQIARRLTLSQATVKVALRSILRKLRVHTRTQAVTTALRMGIIEHASSEESRLRITASRCSASQTAPDVHRQTLEILSHIDRVFLALLAQGLSNAAMADGLRTSVPAIKAALTRLFRKVGARNRAHAAAIALSLFEPSLSPESPARR